MMIKKIGFQDGADINHKDVFEFQAGVKIERKAMSGGLFIKARPNGERQAVTVAC